MQVLILKFGSSGPISTSPNVHHGRHALETVEEVVLLRVTGRGCVIFFLWTEGLTEAFQEFFADIKTVTRLKYFSNGLSHKTPTILREPVYSEIQLANNCEV